MQENYLDGSKGEIKFVDWKNLLAEIKKSLNKEGVKSVTISCQKDSNPGNFVRVEEETKSLFEEFAEAIKENSG